MIKRNPWLRSLNVANKWNNLPLRNITPPPPPPPPENENFQTSTPSPNLRGRAYYGIGTTLPNKYLLLRVTVLNKRTLFLE